MAITQYPLQVHQPRAVLREVIYEIQMLVATSTQITDCEFTNNALLESRLLHIRNLLDFFEKSDRSIRRTGSDRIENDDVLAQDYGFSPRVVSISEQDRKRLNKALAHIAYERIEYRAQNQMHWSHKAILLPVLTRCGEFLQFLICGGLPQVDSRDLEICADLLAQARALALEISKLPTRE
jgi:hypothetical protein